MNNGLDEAEGRIEETAMALQTVSMLIKRLAKYQAKLDARLIEQDGRARRENLRLYGIPEDKQGADIWLFFWTTC